MVDEGSDFELEAHTLIWSPPHSYILEEGICYLALCDPTYPAKLAFSYLENLHKDFSEQHGNDVHKASRPYHFIEFGTYYIYTPICRLRYIICLFLVAA